MAGRVSYKELASSHRAMSSSDGGQIRRPGLHFNNMEQMQAIVTGCVESDSPFILQVSSGARKYATRCPALSGQVQWV